MTKHRWFALIALAAGLSAWLTFVWSTPATTGRVATHVVSSGPSVEQQMLILAALVGLLVFLLLSGAAALASALRP